LAELLFDQFVVVDGHEFVFRGVVVHAAFEEQVGQLPAVDVPPGDLVLDCQQGGHVGLRLDQQFARKFVQHVHLLEHRLGLVVDRQRLADVDGQDQARLEALGRLAPEPLVLADLLVAFGDALADIHVLGHALEPLRHLLNLGFLLFQFVF